MNSLITQPPTVPLRFGVEEEFVLTDPHSRITVPAAAPVLAHAARALGDRAQHEFLASQVEACTRPVATAAELRAELAESRTALLTGAERAGCRLIATGTPVLPSRHPLTITPDARYLDMARRVDGVADQIGAELSGCHVHLGDLTVRQALALSAALRGWLPLFQAICANSPFCEGTDLGTAAVRPERYSHWPTFGPAPVLDEPGYHAVLDRLIAEDVIPDRRAVFWYARPSTHLPTLEIRIADTSADLDTVVLLAVLLRGLAHTLLDPRRHARPVPETTLRRAHHSAAAHGLDARLPHPPTGEHLPARELLTALLEFTTPALLRTDDLPLARRLTAGLLTGGSGADRQRAALAGRGTLTAVVDDLARRTATL
ncbi:carboxylate-amine ligase [Kitasatospora cheerisanensis]|uniref:Putative glutamate--cysteine ligase 2 n=1 Tax=Kitasatospora cheerisanensis KCTC 2395 TaxID=1348663 RepID=A0A066ZBN8_9ACTN|nr:YbdK family carboxylate-amine ligase [Kitasatospora cheerisanensis]KDN87575.1 putative carboxylate-amine ligase [Kitasatospora cheerisanensis KCTC 2395]